jgi:NAD(P)-dependent dehydrogenase (short-subunit alcohol dehydrogenase family)
MKSVVVVTGAGSIGQAIARRVGAGKHVLLADLRAENAKAAADVMSNAGFEVSTATVDISSRESIHELALAATKLGEVTGAIHAAGVSPSQASPATILKVDLTAPPSCSRSSGALSREAGPAWSSRRSRAIVWER